jgi:bla regulator protein blaR1
MMATFTLPVILQIVAARVLSSVPQGLLIAACAWLLLRILGRQNSATRFALWFSALIGVVVLPFLPGLISTRLTSTARLPELILPASWAMTIVGVWAVVAAFAFGRIAIGVWNLWRLRKSFVPVPAEQLPPALQRTLQEHRGVRPVRVCRSERVQGPAAIGLFSPVVVVPDWFLTDLPPGEASIILVHELAHLRRRDDWTNLAQKIAGAIFFFHPAVWWINRRLSLEREMACDDAVLASASTPHAYARCLVALAERSFLRRGLSMAQAAVRSVRETTLRLQQILDTNRPASSHRWRPALVVMGALSVLCLAALPLSPDLVAFQSSAPSAVASLPVPQPSLPRAAVIPASAKSAGGELPALSAKADLQPKVHRRRSVAPRTVYTNLKHARPQVPPVLRASVATPLAPPTQMLVVVQTSYNGRGSSMWRVYVWQVTFAPACSGLQTGAAAKKT